MNSYHVHHTPAGDGSVARAEFTSDSGLVISFGRWARDIGDSRSMALDALADELGRRGDRYGSRGEP